MDSLGSLKEENAEKRISVAFPRVNIKVRVGVGVSCFKEQVILHNLGSVACGKKYYRV